MRTGRMCSSLALLTAALATCAVTSVGTADAAPAKVGTVATAAITRWPATGEEAYVVNGGHIVASPHLRSVPIASVAKVMTAYLVLSTDPLSADTNGFTITVTKRDVADYVRRRDDDQSVVPVRTGERLTERQALAALLLPSGNNIAIILARRVGGTVARFVALMNRTARTLGMNHTHYTDPSGFLASTRSTAVDQLRLALVAMRVPAFARMVARRSYHVPVAGTIRTTDHLLGHDGFSGIKTGSDDAAGGCFAFRSWHRVDGKGLLMTGVVLGQPGSDELAAGLAGGKRLVDRVVANASGAPKPARATPCRSQFARRAVVVDISRQRAWLCSRRTLVRTTLVTTGAVDKGDGTPTGSWHVYAKQRDTTLYPASGGAYHVHFWMPYTGAYGMHDAPWQKFPYGSPKYRTHGSHGCVHFPEKQMRFLYHWAPVGTRVTIRR